MGKPACIQWPDRDTGAETQATIREPCLASGRNSSSSRSRISSSCSNRDRHTFGGRSRCRRATSTSSRCSSASSSRSSGGPSDGRGHSINQLQQEIAAVVVVVAVVEAVVEAVVLVAAADLAICVSVPVQPFPWKSTLQQQRPASSKRQRQRRHNPKRSHPATRPATGRQKQLGMPQSSAYTQKAEDCRAGRKCSISQEEWWKTHGHTVSAAKQQRQKPAKIMKKPSANTPSMSSTGHEVDGAVAAAPLSTEPHMHEVSPPGISEDGGHDVEEEPKEEMQEKAEEEEEPQEKEEEDETEENEFG